MYNFIPYSNYYRHHQYNYYPPYINYNPNIFKPKILNFSPKNKTDNKEEKTKETCDESEKEKVRFSIGDFSLTNKGINIFRKTSKF